MAEKVFQKSSQQTLEVVASQSADVRMDNRPLGVTPPTMPRRSNAVQE